MNCSLDLIHAYLDDELDAVVEEHLAHCRACSEIHAGLVETRDDIRSAAPYYRAPASLEKSVRIDRWRWAAIAASLLLASSIGWNFARPRPRDLVAETILSDHVRSLIGTHLLDVESTDRHTVKPWFNGKLDFSPDVKDYVDQGFPLIGGRLEYFSGRTVAALVYRRSQHVVTLFTWPGEPSPDGELSLHGFHAIHWTSGEMTNWAVSDIPLAELEQFKTLTRK